MEILNGDLAAILDKVSRHLLPNPLGEFRIEAGEEHSLMLGGKGARALHREQRLARSRHAFDDRARITVKAAQHLELLPGELGQRFRVGIDADPQRLINPKFGRQRPADRVELLGPTTRACRHRPRLIGADDRRLDRRQIVHRDDRVGRKVGRGIVLEQAMRKCDRDRDDRLVGDASCRRSCVSRFFSAQRLRRACRTGSLISFRPALT